MRNHSPRPKPLARWWLAAALLLSATVADATDPVGTVPVGRAGESISGARPHALTANPHIGRIFFSPAERRDRHPECLAATPTAPIGTAPVPRDRRLFNFALRSR